MAQLVGRAGVQHHVVDCDVERAIFEGEAVRRAGETRLGDQHALEGLEGGGVDRKVVQPLSP